MARFIALPDLNCSRNAVPLAAVKPAKRKSLVAIVCPLDSSSTPSGRSGAAGHMASLSTLANCYRNSLQVALENGIKTIAFPAISCGAYGYPLQEAAQIAVKTAREFITAEDKIEKVIFVVWDEHVYEAYREALQK